MARTSYFAAVAGVTPKGASRLAPARRLFGQWEPPARAEASPVVAATRAEGSKTIAPRVDPPNALAADAPNITSLRPSVTATVPRVVPVDENPVRGIEETTSPDRTSASETPTRRGETSLFRSGRPAVADAIVETHDAFVEPHADQPRDLPQSYLHSRTVAGRLVSREHAAERAQTPAPESHERPRPEVVRQEIITRSIERASTVAPATVEIGSINVSVVAPPPMPVVAPPMIVQSRQPPRVRLARGFSSAAGLSQE
jgi:hypothetical protein